MTNLKITLVGQPNVGKSSLLNAIAGSKSVVSNYPGTTVEITEIEKVFKNIKIHFIDTPGAYSISDRSEDEKIAKKVLFENRIDGAIIVADAVSFERSLYMILQILEAKIPSIIALNFTEEAEKKGININCEKMEKFLNIPVIPINPLNKRGINKLIDATLKIKNTPKKYFEVEYDDHIESAIDEISLQIKGNLPKRFVALRVLENDEYFYKYLKYKGIVKKVKQNLKEHPRVAKDISITRYGTALFIAEKITQIINFKKKLGLSEKIDRIFLHKFWGQFATGAFLFTLFGTLLYVGNLMQAILMNLTEKFLSYFIAVEQSIVNIILVQSITGVAAGISIALPYVFLFYLLLGLLEDIGLLSRFVVNAEKFLKRIGLSGKAFIPLILGFGCTAPACRACRILSSEKEQFTAASLFSFVPCSSRIAIIMGIVGFYGGIKLAFFVTITLFAAGLIWALCAKKIIFSKNEPLLLELPPYRKPLIKNIIAKSWIRMKDFVCIVIPFLALGGIVYSIFNIMGITDSLIKPLSPITAWLGLPAATIIPLLFGFLQKDLTGAMLLSVLGNEISLVLTPLQIYTFGVASTIGIPCIIASGMLAKEFGFKKAITLTIVSIIYGFLIAGLIWRTIDLLCN
ncbi:MAG: ferrous iron transport protein B [Patescibacteria group bacterium]|nr:ferrous iron transport protein B [Patescibacteria group bacterium]